MFSDFNIKFWLTIGMTVISIYIKAQDPYIFSNDPFSGISAVGISPTQSYLNSNRYDVHLFSESAFIQNRYGYISKSSLIGLTSAEIKESDIENNITGENTKQIWDYFNDETTGYHFSNEIMGPSASLNFEIAEKGFSVGLFSKLRTQSSIIEVDNYMKYTNQEIIEPVLYTLNPFDANFMNWTEVGLNIATEILPNSYYAWIAGLNVKYLMGNDAFYVKNHDVASMRREDEEITLEDGDLATQKNLFVSDFDVEVGYATSYNFENDAYEYQSMGKGIGFDVGLAFVDYGDHDSGYDLKISANILDVGVVNFDGFVHSYIGENFQYTNNPNLEDVEFESPEQYAQIISNELYGNPNQSLVSNEFKIGLPTSLHFNASKRMGENNYINLDVMQRFPIFENSLKRSNIVTASYIMSQHKFSYGASLSAYEYEIFRVGAFLRYGPLIIGSENALPFIVPHGKLKGADFYIGFKIYPMRNRDMERRSREKCWCD
ncbi:hypothetical protein [Moheibacter lacus]|uniref:DUF5723 domain-containing protein n=1 Tax=Moheibacter lacus TaxID=2745851 RepID=A0A838ZRX4_9FLAO|nr:hypothetical protein [Moheibacter lacus]MBA5629672.1 hypothetical protein [Moheibacter lacus]